MFEPRILGQFNYLQYKKDLYALILIPYVGSSAQIVARNLTFKAVRELMDDLNDVLFEFKESQVTNNPADEDVA